MAPREHSHLPGDQTALFGLLTTFFGQSMVGLCLIDSRQARICFANEWMQSLAGDSFRAGASLSTAWPEGAKRLLPLLARVEHSQQAQRQDSVTLLGDVGEHNALSGRYFAVTVQPWNHQDESMRGALFILREDTEAVIARLRLEKEQETQTAMFRMLSHDLRNPIGSAKMAADGICRAKDVPEKIANKAKRASQALRRADDMISRFLDLRTLHAGQRLPLQRSPLTLADAVEPLVDELNLAFAGRVHLSIEERGEGLWDPQYISRAVGNLVENAAKYGEPEGVIEVRLRREEQHVCLEVQNAGTTLSTQETDAMMSTKPWRRDPGHSSHAGGWGMGLALVRSVVEAHEGQLHIRSQDARTCMSMRFLQPGPVGSKSP